MFSENEDDLEAESSCVIITSVVMSLCFIALRSAGVNLLLILVSFNESLVFFVSAAPEAGCHPTQQVALLDRPARKRLAGLRPFFHENHNHSSLLHNL